MATNEGDAIRKLREAYRRKAAGFTVNDLREDLERFLRDNPNASMSPEAMEVANDFATPEDIPKKRTYIKPTEVRIRDKNE